MAPRSTRDGTVDALVSREQLWYGRFPEMCVKTGAPADRLVTVGFERVPPWTFLLLLAGILPFFIAALFLRERVRGAVPVTDEVVARYHGFRRGLVVGWVLPVVGVLLAVVAESAWPLTLAALGVVLVVVTEVRRSAAWIDGVPVRGTPFVELRRVHPAFAAAVGEQVTGTATR